MAYNPCGHKLIAYNYPTEEALVEEVANRWDTDAFICPHCGYLIYDEEAPTDPRNVDRYPNWLPMERLP